MASASRLGVLVGHHVEADDDRVGSLGQQDIALGDAARHRLQDVQPDLARAQLGEILLQHVHRALHVGPDDQVQLLDVAGLDLAEQVLHRDLRPLRQRFLAGPQLVLLGGGFGRVDIIEAVEPVACLRNIVQADHLDRHRAGGDLDLLAVAVRHASGRGRTCCPPAGRRPLESWPSLISTVATGPSCDDILASTTHPVAGIVSSAFKSCSSAT